MWKENKPVYHIIKNIPLQFIHSDLFASINPEFFNGNRYILELYDYTHFTVVYPLKNKSEVCKYFKIYEAMVTAHFGKRISRFRCDNGREYVTNEIQCFCEEKKIQLEYTIRYTPQPNGVAEGMNRTTVAKARMLLESKLNKDMKVAISAVYLVNRSPTRVPNSTQRPVDVHLISI